MGRGGKERRGKILQAGSALIIKHLWSERLLPWGGGLRSWVIGTGYHLESGDKSKCRRWGTSLWQRAVCADAPCPVRRRAYVLPPRDIINTCSHISYTHALAHTHTHTYIASLDISQMFRSQSNNLWWVCVTELHHAAGQVQPVISDAGEITSMHFGWRAIRACALPCSVASSPRCHNARPDLNYVTQVECKMIKKNLLSTVSTKVLSQINKSVRLPVICCQVNSCETHDASMDAAEVQVWSEVDGIFTSTDEQWTTPEVSS